MSDEIRLGSILLHQRAGPLAAVLVWPIRLLDPDPWIRRNWRAWWGYWHTTWVCGWDGEWIVRSIEGKGAAYRHVGEFEGKYRVVNWLPELNQKDVDEFINYSACHGYDALGYFICAANRLSRGAVPAVVDRNRYCWEDISTLCDRFGRPFMNYGAMAYLPILIKLVDGGTND